MIATPGRPGELRDLAATIAREAGTLLVERRPERLAADTKSSPTDAVTAMDRASERLIVTRLRETRPHDAILGEEGTAQAGTSGVRWIVDPLDGTVNYLYGLPAWSVSIAAEAGGFVVAGAVYDARGGAVYEAVRGGGARYAGTPIGCTAVTDLSLALIGTGFSYAAASRARQGLIAAELLPAVRDIRRIGSAALDLCAVAAGQFDGYVERGIQPWDRAAGLLIAVEAGARAEVFDDDGVEVTMAAAPGIYDALRTAYSEAATVATSRR